MNRIADVIVSVFFPHRCAYCGKVVANTLYICKQCENNLPRISGAVCNKCGREKDKCSCKKAKKYYNGIAAPFYFKGNVRKGIHNFKFRRCVSNAEAYGKEMCETVRDRFSGVCFDFITAVPISDKSRRERGYNQCEILAQKLSQNIGIEYRKGVVVKLCDTKKQHKISLMLRRGNLTGVFDVPNPSDVENKTVLLCDDISTTGETFNECAKMLWLNGAKAVYCISVALTSPREK